MTEKRYASNRPEPQWSAVDAVLHKWFVDRLDRDMGSITNGERWFLTDDVLVAAGVAASLGIPERADAQEDE